MRSAIDFVIMAVDQYDLFGTTLNMTVRCKKHDLLIYMWYLDSHPLLMPPAPGSHSGSSKGSSKGSGHGSGPAAPPLGVELPDPAVPLPGGELLGPAGGERPDADDPRGAKEDRFLSRMFRTFYEPMTEWSCRTQAEWGAAVMRVACELTELAAADVRRLVRRWDAGAVARFQEETAAMPREEQLARLGRLQTHLAWRNQPAQIQD